MVNLATGLLEQYCEAVTTSALLTILSLGERSRERKNSTRQIPRPGPFLAGLIDGLIADPSNLKKGVMIHLR
jgi:hypothetical protein